MSADLRRNLLLIALGLFVLLISLYAIRIGNGAANAPERVLEDKAKDISAQAPVDLLPKDNVPGVMPPKPDAPTFEAADEYDIQNFSFDLARVIGVYAGQDMKSAQKTIQDYFTQETEGEGAPATFDTTYLANGLTRYVATRTGYADDSVKAEQVVAYFQPLTAKASALKSYGIRLACYRADNPNNWQTEVCP